MSDGIDEIDGWIKDVIESLSPSKRAQALKKIGAHLKKSNQKRLSKQIGPDGKKWAARKDGTRSKMMARLRLSRNLRVKSSSQHVSLGWSGLAGGIARVHHFGLTDRVSEKGVKHKYEARQLLGISREDSDAIGEILEELIES